MESRVVVLGSNSFSGSHFVSYLLERGHEVVGMSRSAEPHAAFLPYKWSAAADQHTGKFSFQRADLNDDFDTVCQVIGDLRPEWVVNFAAQSMVAESWLHPEHWFQTNCVATIRLHNFLKDCSWLKRYVHISTPEVYGSTGGFISESTPFNPSTPYAVSRAAADMSLISFFKA